jgi:hypothetical protein
MTVCILSMIPLQIYSVANKKTCGTDVVKKNFVSLVRERTIPTQPPPLVGKDSANF